MKKFLLVLGLIISSNAFAQLVGDDDDYLQRTVGKHKFIYPAEYQSLINDVEKKYLWLNSHYQKEFMWSFDEDSVLVMASSKNQIANGFATQYPRLMTMFYNGGPEFIDDFAVTSWLDTLLSHETVHLYQLNIRKQYSSFLKSIFHNAQPGLGLPFTYTITPHLFTPTFLMEGNATYNEGRFGNGGRLYSGYYRALFLQLLKAGKVTSNRLMNDRIDWPFGAEKYVVGGYFFSQISEDFGSRRANSFFDIHSYQYFFPFRIHSTFVDLFDIGYERIFENLEKTYRPVADRQKTLGGESLGESYQHIGFTKDHGVIRFMLDSYMGEPQVCAMIVTADHFSCEKTKLPFGRVFELDGELVTAAYLQTHPTEIRAGIFKKDYKRVNRYNDQFVYSLSDKGVLYADAKKSFDRTRLYKDGVAVSDIQSSPLMDDKGHLYYFKQLGEKRRLYMDDQILFEMDGHYGRPVDVDSSGQVYFTGAVEEGSALFKWNGKIIQAVVESDRVVDAKLLNDQKLLVAEVTSDGFEYRIAELVDRPGQPVNYAYKAKDDEYAKNLPKEFAAASTSANAPTDGNKPESYKPWSSRELNGIDPIFGSTENGGSVWFLNLRFSDPLQRYYINTIAGNSGWDSYTAGLAIGSQKHRLLWEFSALYEQEALIETYLVGTKTDERLLGRYSETTLKAELAYPITKTPLWSSEIGSAYSYESTTEIDSSIRSFVSGSYVNAVDLKYDLTYSFQNMLDHAPAELVGLDLLLRHEGEGSGWERGTQVYRGDVKLQYDVLWQTYLSTAYTGALAKGSRNTLRLDESLIPLEDPTEIQQLSHRYLSGGFYELRKVNAELRQGVRLGLYHQWFPLGLRRFAPFLGFSEYYGTRARNTSADTLFHEAYYGVELELLVLHKFPARFELISAENSLDPDPDPEFLFRFGQNFEF